LGVIYKINEDFRENYDISKIKDILNIKNENVFLSSYRLELLPFIAEYYFCPIHNSLSLFLPKNLIEKI
jgi:primosomal protein N'